MAIGMSYEQYWYGDNLMVVAYRKAHKLKCQQRNEELWLQGLYNFSAISIALSNIHLDGKSHTVNKYMEKPFELFPKTEIQKITDAEKDRKKVIDSLNRWKAMFDKKGQ